MTREAPRRRRCARERAPPRARAAHRTAGHHDHDLWLGGRDALVVELLGRLAREAEDILTACQLDQLRRPVAGNEHRVEPLERGDARVARLAHRDPNAIDAPRDQCDERDALIAPPVASAIVRTSPRVSRAYADRVRSRAGARQLAASSRTSSTDTAHTGHSSCVTISSARARAGPHDRARRSTHRSSRARGPWRRFRPSSCAD